MPFKVHRTGTNLIPFWCELKGSISAISALFAVIYYTFDALTGKQGTQLADLRVCLWHSSYGCTGLDKMGRS